MQRPVGQPVDWENFNATVAAAGLLDAMPRQKRPKNHLIASDADASMEAQVGELLRKLRDVSHDWLLITQQLIFPCEAHIHGSRESLIGDMADALTCRCLIAAVYHQGRQLSEDEIAPLRAEALDSLGPISRARADGLL